MPNKIVYCVMGHVTKGGNDKPPVRLFNDEGKTAMAQFTVVAFKNQRTKEGKYEDVPFFFRCKVWGKRAEWCKQYLQEKTAVLIFGEPEKESFFDRDTGEKIEQESLIINSIDFAGTKNSNEGGGGRRQSSDDESYAANSDPGDIDVGELGDPIDMDNPPVGLMETPGD